MHLRIGAIVVLTAWSGLLLAARPRSPSRGPAHPIACVLTSSTAFVELHFRMQGCFGGWASEVQILKRASGTGTFDASFDHDGPAQLHTPMSNAETRLSLLEIVHEMGTPQVSRGGSTSYLTVDVRWRCGDAPDRVETIETSDWPDEHNHLRGHALYEIAKAAAARAAR